ncbi:MAG: PHP domain-containing protein, partial [Angelakisella sp.]
MKIIGDTHTHTVACEHAYSTVTENANHAKSLGHRFLALTDHCPAMPGCPHEWYFTNLPRFIPQELDGLVVLRGCEANILKDGTVDLSDDILKPLDWVIASMHGGIMPIGFSKEKYTNIWLKIASNPYIDCIGHLGQLKYMPDYETVIRAFVENNKVIEINNSSPVSRPGCEDNCREIVRICKKLGAKLVLSSDSHFYSTI